MPQTVIPGLQPEHPCDTSLNALYVKDAAYAQLNNAALIKTYGARNAGVVFDQPWIFNGLEAVVHFDWRFDGTAHSFGGLLWVRPRHGYGAIVGPEVCVCSALLDHSVKQSCRYDHINVYSLTQRTY